MKLTGIVNVSCRLMAGSIEADVKNIAKGVIEMGAGSAMDMKHEVDRGTVRMAVVLHWHLTSNHYPPIPAAFISVAQEAIDKINMDESDSLVVFPEGLAINGQQSLPAYEIARLMHLESFIDQEVL